MSVFKNYEPGEPTCRLYVKNVAKQVEEKVSVCSTHKNKQTKFSVLFIYSMDTLDSTIIV